jgi:hypothetical protein
MSILNPNQYVISNSSGSSISTSYVLENDFETIIEYIDMSYQIMGIDMNFEKFKEMSQSDKQSFIRDIKIKKILK